MSTKYFALLTNTGAAKLAKATALGMQVEITQMAVGDGNGALPTPDPAQTALAHEIRRAPLNALTIDPLNTSQIIAEQVIPEDVGGWWIREIGLFDKDGDMVAIANCAETYKPQLQEGSGRVQVIRVILIVSSTEAVTLKIDPAVVLATRKYVDSEIIEVKNYIDDQLLTHEQSRNHPDATLTDKGFVQLSSSTGSLDETMAATPKAVRIAMDNANARLAKERNLADLTNIPLARQSLQLGNSATRNVGATAGTVAAGDDSRITGALQKDQNGADIPNKPLFLQNVGLTETVKQAAGAVPSTRKINNHALDKDLSLTPGDIGALPVTGGKLNGPLGIGTDNALGGNSIVLGDNDTGFKQDGDGVLGIYANNARVGYIDNSGLHMLNDVYSGDAHLGGNGDIFGSVWGGWLNDFLNNNYNRKNTASLGDYGWVRDESTGFIMQWGTLGSSNGTYNFPREFPASCFAVFVTNTNQQGGSVDNAFGYPVSKSQFFAATKASTDGNVVNNYPVAWFAIGR
ncbi:phage tail protein [Salmonella enterica subsp. enterica serovar Senftenberg]|nr:phage tail protein [Salmonella enterica]ECH4007421.1 phage tail protein [Salmonella enterica subsp. enterica serovar Montevideo]ECH9344036.1 phage tail protein [Salmonella enterica subsp. enterica]ECV9764310.1 phage tail protein [Salmonella enterica subsp. enterica serovar Senftenberg]EAM3477977.1 phage tail protein [Salmonella enterica]